MKDTAKFLLFLLRNRVWFSFLDSGLMLVATLTKRMSRVTFWGIFFAATSRLPMHFLPDSQNASFWSFESPFKRSDKSAGGPYRKALRICSEVEGTFWIHDSRCQSQRSCIGSFSSTQPGVEESLSQSLYKFCTDKIVEYKLIVVLSH